MDNEVPDEIRILKDGWRLVGDYVPTQLISRGWAVSDLDVTDSEPLEFFWPPTAPIGHGGIPEQVSPAAAKRPGMYRPRRTPWTAPTRISQFDSGWRVDFGETRALQPDLPSAMQRIKIFSKTLRRLSGGR